MTVIKKVLSIVGRVLAFPFINRPTRSYWILPEVIITVVSGLFVVCAITTANVGHSGLTLSQSLSPDHINNFFTSTMKVPLGVLAAIAAILALFAANHRSEQSIHSMALQRAQNNFANFYAHRKAFSEHCELMPEASKEVLRSSNTLHKALFPNAREGDLSLNEEEIGRYLSSAFGIVGVLGDMATGEKDDDELSRKLFVNTYPFIECCDRLDLPMPHYWKLSVRIEGNSRLENLLNEQPNIGAKLRHLYTITMLLRHALTFEPNAYSESLEHLQLNIASTTEYIEITEYDA